MENTDNITKKIETALKEIRTQLQLDGGDIELVAIVEGKASVRLKGACQGCPMAAATLQGFIERVLKERVPEIVSVEAV